MVRIHSTAIMVKHSDNAISQYLLAPWSTCVTLMHSQILLEHMTQLVGLNIGPCKWPQRRYSHTANRDTDTPFFITM